MKELRTLHHMPSEGNPVYIKQMHLAKGMWAETHKHRYDHYGVLGAGKVVVELDGTSKEYEAPCVINIKEGVTHKITALEDSSWFCIHATDEDDENKVDNVLIKGA